MGTTDNSVLRALNSMIISSHGCVSPTHSVQLYHDDSALLYAVSQSLSVSMAAGKAAVVVATPAHQQGIAAHLTVDGVDLDRAIRNGRYVALDAAGTLDGFMEGEHVDESRFDAVVGDLIRQVTVMSADTNLPPAVFGEMVALLAADGQFQAALDLEHVWNSLAHDLAFSLHCGYPLSVFNHWDAGGMLECISEAHSTVIPAEPQHGDVQSQQSPGDGDMLPIRTIRNGIAAAHGFHKGSMSGDVRTSRGARNARQHPGDTLATDVVPATAEAMASRLQSVIDEHRLPLDLQVGGGVTLVATRSPGFTLHLDPTPGLVLVESRGQLPVREADPVWEPLWTLLETWGTQRDDITAVPASRDYPDLLDRMC